MDPRGRSELRREIAMLRDELTQRDQMIQNQFTEMHDHMNSYSELFNEKEELYKRVVEQTGEKYHLEELFNTVLLEQNQFQESIAEKDAQIEILREQVHRLQGNYVVRENLVTSLRTEIATLQERNLALQGQYTEVYHQLIHSHQLAVGYERQLQQRNGTLEEEEVQSAARRPRPNP